MVIKKSDWLISHHLSYRTTVSFFLLLCITVLPKIDPLACLVVKKPTAKHRNPCCMHYIAYYRV